MHDISMSQGLTRVASGNFAVNAVDDAAAGASGDQTPRPVPPSRAGSGGQEPVVELPSTSSQQDAAPLEGSRLTADPRADQESGSHVNLFELEDEAEDAQPQQKKVTAADILQPSLGLLGGRTESGRVLVSGLNSIELRSPSGRNVNIADGAHEPFVNWSADSQDHSPEKHRANQQTKPADPMQASPTPAPTAKQDVPNSPAPPSPEQSKQQPPTPTSSIEQIQNDPASTLDTLLGDVNREETRRSLEMGYLEPSPVVPPSVLEEANRHNELYQEQQNTTPQWVSLARKAAPAIAVASLALAVAAAGGPTGVAQQATVLSQKAATYFAANAKAVLSLFTLATSLYLQASGIPTVLQIHREGSTGTLSPFPYASMIANCSVWAVFGIMHNSMACIIPNVTGFLFGVTYLAFFAGNTKQSMRSTYAGVATILGGLAFSVATYGRAAAPAIGAFGAIFCFVLMASPLATVRTVIKTKSTASMPFPMVVGTFMDSLSWCLLGMIVLKEPNLYMPNIGGLIAALMQLSLFVIYGFGSASKAKTVPPTAPTAPAFAS